MNGDVRFRVSKSQAEITREWDLIAPARDQQLRDDDDVTFRKVLKPLVVGSTGDAQTIIDIGCGTGRLTSALQRPGRRIVGIDPSAESIQIARSHDSSGEYIVNTLESWVAAHPNERFDLAVVNMVLMDVPDLAGFCRALGQIARGGRVFATITHPSFWPLYWGYASNDGFDYMTETIVEAPFKTTSKTYPFESTHIHRPLFAYFAELVAAGLTVTGFEELRGTESAEIFPFPRFAAFEARA